MTTTLTRTQPVIIVGVDAHQQTHHAWVVDAAGRKLADREFPATRAGYQAMIDWAAGLGQIDRFGIESTGSFAADLTRSVLAAGIEVIEVNRPDAALRRSHGKSDPIDAEAAARAVLSGRATARPKATTGIVEAVRVLMVTRDSAVKARTAAYSQLRDLATTAPAPIRETLLPLTSQARVRKAAGYRPDPARLADPIHAAKLALRTLATRIQVLDQEIKTLTTQLTSLVEATAPTLLALPQIGPITAAQLLVTAGQNLDRFRSEAAFAKLTGTAPLPASSGKSRAMRINRGGDRQANKALHLIAIGRLKNHPATISYRQRRETEGLSLRDIIRCLKRAIARNVYQALRKDLLTTT